MKKHTKTIAIALAVALVIPLLVHAGAPGEATIKNLTVDIKAFLTPFFSLALLVAFVALLCKALSPVWFVLALICVGGFFGHEQVIAWFRALTGM